MSSVAGLKMAYMLVQLVAVLLLPVGVFRFAKIWVDERSASYAALGTIFLGALSFLVYQAGQLATVSVRGPVPERAAVFLRMVREASGRSFFKGIFVSLAAAAAHHVTLIFGTVLVRGTRAVGGPAGCSRWTHPRRHRDSDRAGELSLSPSSSRSESGWCCLPVLDAPYIQHPIHQIPIPHDSRNNFLLNSMTGINYFVIPYGALIIALPFIFSARGIGSPTAPAAGRLLADLPVRPGRHNAISAMASRPRLRDSDLRAFHLLGHADGDANCGLARDSSCSIVFERKLPWRCRWQPWSTIGAPCVG